MPIVHIDRKTISAITTPDLYWDETLKGFGYRVHAEKTGKLRCTYIIQWRIKGSTKQRKHTIGDAAKISAGAAREEARRMFAEITLGRDPEGKTADTTPKVTFLTAINTYLEMVQGEVRPKTFRIKRGYLIGAAYFGPLHKVALNDVAKQAVAQCLAAIRQRTSDVTAGRARAHLSAAFVRLMQEGIAESNPVIGTKPQDEKPERSRVLTNDELLEVWRACQDDDFGRIVRLLILTGCRRGEIGGLRWSEIHDDAIHLPAERCKNGRAHIVPLTPLAMQIIESIPHRADRDFLFGERSVDGFDTWQAKTAFKDGISEPWVIHDLRRTCATGLANLGFQPHVIECVLNHTAHRAGVGGVYNKSPYAREVKTALLTWSDHIASIISGEERKVVPLRVS